MLQQTLNGYSNAVHLITFSHDSKLLALASSNKIIKIWDIVTSILQQTLQGHSSGVTLVVFSHDPKILASALDDRTIRI
jgi:WD40 repeat protein